MLRDEGFEIGRWNPLALDILGDRSGDQLARHIISISRSLFDGMGRRHRAGIGVKQNPDQQARLVLLSAVSSFEAIFGELALDLTPKIFFDYGRLFAWIGYALMDDLASVDAVL